LYFRANTYKQRKYKGRTPWTNDKNLVEDIDKLPHGPSWRMEKIEVEEDSSGRISTAYLFVRDIIEVIRELIGNPAFKGYMRYAPERHWTAEDCRVRIYGETWSGNWWWRMQVSANNGTEHDDIYSPYTDNTSR
jgi:hypothetical protein